MAETQNLWWSPTLGAILKHHDGSFRVLGGGSVNAWGWFIPAEWPADAERYMPEKNPARRQSEEIALAALQEAAGDVCDLLGPRYNTRQVIYSITNLARKAVAELNLLQGRINTALEASTMDEARAALLGTPTAAITQPDRSGRWVDGELLPFGPHDLDGWQPTHPEAVAGD
ncbi:MULTISPECIES: hypothetical protein [Amycolatopsis]|uniref:Uncharacterized protein n=1 Tax=Amycolatopsis albidoflavus TaxID=102226 RepID=A0ABW5I5Q3_9PSEU